MLFLSNRKLRLIIITLLLLIFCFFLGMFKPKAELLDVGVYGANIVDDNGSHWNTNSCYSYFQTGDIGIVGCQLNNINLYNNLTFRLFLTNGSNLSNKTISFVAFKYNQDFDVNGIFMSDNENSYSCEIYTTLTNENTQYYNVICPNLPSFTGNATSVNFQISNSGNGSFVKSPFLGISKINGWTNGTTTINDIKNQTTNINNSINDSSIDSSGASSSASDWNNKNATNGTITNLLTLPITLLQAIVNGLQTSCSSFSLGSLFGTNISLPCINVGNLIGSGLWTTIDILFSGFMILAIAKKLIKIFNDFTNLKSNQIDELYGGGNK